jgi:NAD(P)H-flavin reductase
MLNFNKTEADIIWRDELRELESTVDEFKHHIILSGDSKWTGHQGRIRTDLLKKLLPDAKPTDANRLALVCGPKPFNETSQK